jgi:hypothetical protein
MKTSGVILTIAGGAVIWYLLDAKKESPQEESVLEFLARKGLPTSDQNIIYDDIVGGIGRAASGDESWSAGTWLYDLFNKPEKPAEVTAPDRSGVAWSRATYLPSVYANAPTWVVNDNSLNDSWT